MTDKEIVLSKYPNATCRLECCTDQLENWEGPALYEYIVRSYEKAIGDYAAYPDKAWYYARLEIESEK
jgi:hypothetical protein